MTPMARDPGYWRRWRREHPEYRARQTELRRERRRRVGRTEEYRRAALRRRSRAQPPVPQLFPDLRQPGAILSGWREELSLDLRQERALAELEGRDPDEAARRYAAREWTWASLIAPLFDVAS